METKTCLSRFKYQESSTKRKTHKMFTVYNCTNISFECFRHSFECPLLVREHFNLFNAKRRLALLKLFTKTTYVFSLKTFRFLAIIMNDLEINALRQLTKTF